MNRILEFMTYQEYLETPHWREMREHALWHDDYKCRFCGTAMVLEVHHRNYANLGEEKPSDLIVLCVYHHEVTEDAEKGWIEDV